METQPTSEELELMCYRAILDIRKVRLQQEIKDYSQLFKYASPEMSSYPKLVKIVDGMVRDLSAINEELTKAI